MVRRVVYRTLGRALPPQSTRGRALVSEMDMAAVPADSEFAVPPGALLTPLARQVAMDRRIRWQSDWAQPRAGPTGRELASWGARRRSVRAAPQPLPRKPPSPHLRPAPIPLPSCQLRPRRHASRDP
jgi:hypothetical protein